MKERPIIFSGEMVRAILEGRKTQTRRVVKTQPDEGIVATHSTTPPIHWYWCNDDTCQLYEEIVCPYGSPGDRLWVRETWRPEHSEVDIWYLADKTSKCFLGQERWFDADWERNHDRESHVRPSIHMPRWASRITLEITGVKVERVQDISHEDACAEGVVNPVLSCGRIGPFKDLWDTIHGKNHARCWEANPWVWVIEFERVG